MNSNAKEAYSGHRVDILHTIYRTMGDLKIFRHMGIKNLVSTMVLPNITPTSGRTYRDFFEWFCVAEKQRVESLNLKLHPVIGIPPSAAMRNPKILDEALVHLEDYIREKKAMGIGEIGMGDGNKEDYTAFKRQLKIAEKYNVPVIIQAPIRDKTAMTSILLKELKKSKISRAIIDHCDMEVLQLVIREPREEIKVGMTVGENPGAIRPEEALKIYKSYSYNDRICFNSGLGLLENDLFGQCKIVELMEEDGINSVEIQKMVFHNYVDVFPEISSKIKITY